MYLIIKDPTARTVSVELITLASWLRSDYPNSPIWVCFSFYEAEETAKSIAIKENLIYTPGNEI